MLWCVSGCAALRAWVNRPRLACRVWAGADLAPMQSLTNGAGWVTDCAFVECPAWRKLVVGAQDRTVRARRLAPAGVVCSW